MIDPHKWILIGSLEYCHQIQSNHECVAVVTFYT